MSPWRCWWWLRIGRLLISMICNLLMFFRDFGWILSIRELEKGGGNAFASRFYPSLYPMNDLLICLATDSTNVSTWFHCCTLRFRWSSASWMIVRRLFPFFGQLEGVDWYSWNYNLYIEQEHQSKPQISKPSQNHSKQLHFEGDKSK
jgi:hypothetical protein